MNITIKYEIDNTSITDFAALEEEMYQMSLAAGRKQCVRRWNSETKY